jgi:hypothetical protein
MAKQLTIEEANSKILELESELKAEKDLHKSTKETAKDVESKLKADLEAERDSHKSTKESAKNVETTLKAELTAEKKAHQKTVEQSTEAIESLELQLKTAELASDKSNPVARIGKQNYEITIPQFKHEGKVYTAKEACDNQELLKELVEIKSSILKPIQ